MSRKLWKLAAPVLGVALLAGCAADDEGLLLPDTEPAGGELFARYVALGQSNTAGFMSAGINDSTQLLAYPVLLAGQADATFFVPTLADPGCPPPLLGPQPLTSERVGGGTGTTCNARTGGIPWVSNLAVPGSRIVDWVDNGLEDTRSNVLTSLFLGGRTQVQALRDANPTFVTVFPEGNDVLQAAAAGVPAAATSLADFEAALDEVVDAINDEGAEAALFGVINVPLVAPALQPGAYFYALGAAGQAGKPVSLNCAPGTPGGSSLVSFGVLTNPAVTTVSCGADDPGVLSQAEIGQLVQLIGSYNAAIQERAEENDWLYVDTNAVLAPLVQDPNRVRKCQGLATATTPTEFQQAVQTTCPGPTATNFWGSAVSYDPVHFGPEGHRAFTNALIPLINDKYDLSIPTL